MECCPISARSDSTPRMDTWLCFLEKAGARFSGKILPDLPGRGFLNRWAQELEQVEWLADPARDIGCRLRDRRHRRGGVFGRGRVRSPQLAHDRGHRAAALAAEKTVEHGPGVLRRIGA